MNRWTKLAIVLTGLLLGITLACHGLRRLDFPGVKQEIRQRFPDVRQMKVEQLYEILQSTDEGLAPTLPILVDVRRHEEYDVSHLPGAMHLLPDVETPDLGPEIAKDAPIVVYCSVGYRSSRMAERLLVQGYTKVTNLEGSIFEWANEGFPLERDGREVHEVHPYNSLWGWLLDEELHSKPSSDDSDSGASDSGASDSGTSDSGASAGGDPVGRDPAGRGL